jgi:hypothetical protein
VADWPADPHHKTIADFRKDSGVAIKQVCVRFIELCRQVGLLATSSVAIDGSKFKAVNNRDKNFTRDKVERRRTQPESSVSRSPLSQNTRAASAASTLSNLWRSLPPWEPMLSPCCGL